MSSRSFLPPLTFSNLPTFNTPADMVKAIQDNIKAAVDTIQWTTRAPEYGYPWQKMTGSDLAAAASAVDFKMPLPSLPESPRPWVSISIPIPPDVLRIDYERFSGPNLPPRCPAAETFAGRVAFRKTGLPIRRIYMIEGPHYLYIGCTMSVSHATTGEPASVDGGLAVDYYILDQSNLHADDLLMRKVREVIRNMLVHEMDECLLIDGKLANDPHKDERPR